MLSRMMKIKVVFSLAIVLFTSCSEKEKPKVEVDWTKERSIELNKEIALEEKINIKLFLERHKSWKMIETGTGLQYFIYEKGEGDFALAGMNVDIRYKVMTLDEKVCYETASDEVLEIKIDHSERESGLQEGLKKMRVGDKVKMIVPSHLAHGLTGDFNKIPPLTPILLDVEIVEIL